MDFEELACTCGRTFTHPNALGNHRRVCSNAKKRLADVLSRAQDVRAAKKRKKELVADPPTIRLSNARNHKTKSQHSSSIERQASNRAQVFREPDSFNNDQTPVPSTSQPQTAGVAGRPRRSLKPLPGKFRDMVPHSLSPLYTEAHFDKEFIGDALVTSQEEVQESRAIPNAAYPDGQSTFQSKKNAFGLYREYTLPRLSHHDPEEEQTLDDLCSEDTLCSPFHLQQGTQHTAQSQGLTEADYWPYPNRSSFLLGEWYWNGSVQKSRTEFNNLVNIVCSSDFRPEDVQRTPWGDINFLLGSSTSASHKPETLSEQDLLNDAQWICEEVKIKIPFHRLTGARGAREYTVGKFFRRSIIDILKEKVSGSDFTHFHIEPFVLRWESPLAGRKDGPAERVYGEAYSSKLFLEMHQEVQKSPSKPPGCTLPRVAVALMLASDETHLTQFGETKLWPLYMFFGNESKYRRCKPNLHLCEHVAYLTRLTDDFEDFYASVTGGKAPSSPLSTHCTRETFHSQMKIILDDDFVEAYEFGVVITCYDGVQRRFYPRIFTYTADYKEKTVVSTIRNLGNCPCPRCLIPLKQVHDMGTPMDRRWRQNHKRVDDESYRKKVKDAQKLIYKQFLAVNNQDVEKILRPDSLVSTENAFSARLSRLGFSIFQSQATDLMHEVEGGTWRSLFIHLLRVLSCIGDNKTHEMDIRYRRIPSFGRDTCAIPVFEGLLPEQNEAQVNENGCLLDVLFLFATFHGLAKLRMHTDTTIKLLEQATSALGAQLRTFKAKVCSNYDTKELSRETAARARRQLRSKKKTKKGAISKPADAEAPVTHQAAADPARATVAEVASTLPSETQLAKHSNAKEAAPTPSTSGNTAEPLPKPVGKRSKTLNLNTYKFHSLGDYVETIKTFGTTDSYSTEPGELEHRTPKNRYMRTSKKNFTFQLTRIERRQARIRRIRQNFQVGQGRSYQDTLSTVSQPEERYAIGKTQNNPIDIMNFMKMHSNDPAAKHFYRNLKAHLMDRIKEKLGLAKSEGITSILLQRERIYEHRILRLNYTAYDVRRCQDVINPRTSNCDIMMMATPEQLALLNHPYIYARVLGIFHANVVCMGKEVDGNSTRVDFLWVRWFNYQAPSTPLRLDRLSFPLISEDDATGFIDPSLVIRACHVIPAFKSGSVDRNADNTSSLANTTQEWEGYYLDRYVEHLCIACQNAQTRTPTRFADRDALMRCYWGSAVGHSQTLHEVFNESTFPAWPSLGLFKTFCEQPDPSQDGTSQYGDVTGRPGGSQDQIQRKNQVDEDGYNSDDSQGELSLREREDEEILPPEDILARPEQSDDEIDEEDIEHSLMYD